MWHDTDIWFDTDLKVFLMYAAAILIVCLAGRALLMPLKILMRLVLNSLLGGLVLLVINGAGVAAGVSILIPLNLVTAAVTGIAGLPGILLMVLYYQNIL